MRPAVSRLLTAPSALLAAALLAAVLLAAVLLTGCAGGSGSSGSSSGSSPTSSGGSSSASPSAAATPAAPAVGECRSLTLVRATAPVDATSPVACRGPHTAVTVKVGMLPLLESGHLLAVDSVTVRDRVARSCPDSLLERAGGDESARRLSRLRVVWFTPSVEQADAGADRYRCDVVAVRDEDRLLPLPARLAGLLDRPRALDRFGTCGTTAPDARGFRRVACADPHRWRAVDTVDLPADARYLDAAVTDRGDSACEDVAASRADGALRYSWSFEWPTRPQWRDGQRYGWCWVPDAS
ncbi:hypothetical protein ASG49_18000 [Marmoricola sp. Leaf446]|uniref:septum formation family protein n=1 Tax=Marmoricola sp. Leaf446 TaxID=1736379 RepID=UPI0006F53099|nr:septum formation family protein [Marmoricola sp. Leaf446]KQT89614.1 hypothetical protein ASG49_18000 [Marmoricola sp. Leaf446]